MTGRRQRDIKPAQRSARVTVTVKHKVVEDPAGYDELVRVIAEMLDRRRHSGSQR